jgi:hypothetical protein
MKAALRFFALAAFLCMLPTAHAADLSGVWQGEFDFNGNAVPVTLNLKVDGATLTGTIEGLPTTPADIHDGKIDGETVSFWVNSDYQGQTYKLIFNGKLATDHIDFNFGTDDGTWGTTLSVKRGGAPEAAPAPAPTPENIAGIWKGSFDFNGSSMPVTFNLEQNGATVTGNVEGMGAAPVEIHDGKVDANTVTFSINVDYQGQTYALTYTGKISPGQIDFNFGTSDGSWGATLSAKKS